MNTPGLLQFGWRDLFEIALVAYILYRGLLLISGTRALQMVAGLVVLGLAYAGAWLLKLTMVTWLLGLAFTYGAFAAIVIFQPELRAALVASQFVGLIFERDILGIDALAVADHEALVALLAPAFQGYLSQTPATG